MCRYDCDTPTVTVQTAEFSRRENAQFRSDAGLKCRIVRTTNGKCCSWCTSIAGRYEYGKEPQSVYRRHDNCGCTVTYENGRQRQDVWSKRTWESDQPTPVRVEPTRLTGAQGREIEQRNLSQITRFSHAQGEAVQGRNLRYRGLTSGAKSGTINVADSAGIYHGITEEAILRVPKLDIFESDTLNARHQEAARALLREAKKHPPAGRELLIVYDENMNPIPNHGYIIGRVGSVSADNPGIPFHALHNHGSGGTLGYKDLIGFVENQDMLSISAVGNTGSSFIISKSADADMFGYKSFLGNKSKATIFSANGTDFTLGKLVDENEYQKLFEVAAQLNETQRADLANAIRSQMEICLRGGERYGYKYRFKTS